MRWLSEQSWILQSVIDLLAKVELICEAFSHLLQYLMEGHVQRRLRSLSSWSSHFVASPHRAYRSWSSKRQCFGILLINLHSINLCSGGATFQSAYMQCFLRDVRNQQYLWHIGALFSKQANLLGLLVSQARPCKETRSFFSKMSLFCFDPHLWTAFATLIG